MSWNTRGGGLAHNPPFVVDVQVDPKLNEFIPLFTGYTLDCIVQTAKQNEARLLFQQLMETDHQALSELVQTLANIVEFYVESQGLGPGQVEVAIRETVQLVINGYLAMAVKAYPDEFGKVLTQQQAADVQPYIGQLEDVQFQAQRFFGTGGQAGWAGGQASQQRGGWQPQGRGGSAPRGGGWQRGGGNQAGGARVARTRWDEPDQGRGGGYQPATRDNWPGNVHQTRQSGGGGGGGSWTTGGGGARRSGGGSTIWDDTGASTRKAVPTDGSYNAGGFVRQRRESIQQPERQPPPMRQQQQSTRGNAPPAMEKQTVVDGQTFIPARNSHEWPKVISRERPWDWILTGDGTQLRPAFKSDWKVTFDHEVPFTPWYDSNTHILFHIKSPQGVVSEEAIQREDTMKYVDHELDPVLRQKGAEAARARDEKVAPAWQLVEQLRPNPSSPLATAEPLSDDVVGEKVKLVNPDSYLITTSLSDAVKRACLKLKVDNPDVLKQAFELYVERGVLTTTVNPDFGFMYQLTNAASYKQLFQLMIDADANEELLKEVDKRMVVGINQALTQNMGLKAWGITNFLEDFGDLLAALKDDYGDSVVQTFETFAVEVISRHLAHYSEQELDETVRKAVGLDDDVNALVWRERSSVTRLPFTSEDFNIPADTGVMVSPSVYPEMHNTLCAIFERTNDLPYTFYGRYLATEDGVVYSIVKGYLNDEAVLVFKADFKLQ